MIEGVMKRTADGKLTETEVKDEKDLPTRQPW